MYQQTALGISLSFGNEQGEEEGFPSYNIQKVFTFSRFPLYKKCA